MNPDLHYLPFPLPYYLARFVATKLNTPIEQLSSGDRVKAFHVTGKSQFGKLLLNNLKQATGPAKKDFNATIYISVSKYAGRRNNIPCGENVGYDLDDHIIKEIITIFDQYYYDCFYEYMEGAIEAFAISGKQKGIIFKAIESYLHRYGTPDDPAQFERLRKRYQRYRKNHSKTLLS